MSKLQRDESAYHKSSAEIVVINYPPNFPLASDVCVCERKQVDGVVTFLPLQHLRGITDTKHPKAQQALADEKQRRMEIERRSELSETFST